MKRSNEQLREDALAIWQAGVDAVRSDRLIEDYVHVDGRWLHVGGDAISLDDINRIVVVGTGKAGAGMAAGLERALGSEVMQQKQLSGWINVPADCAGPLDKIKLHAARPAGLNEPTQEGVEGTEQILRMVRELTPKDLCLCLLSGGGSALLPAPVDGITLADKQQITKHLSGAGANIQQLNTVRKQLSKVKGGGLMRACNAGRLMTLIISDVIGDPLDIIASGPTVPDPSSPADALRVLNEFHAREAGVSPRVFEYLEQATPADAETRCAATNVVIGNNATAVDAAGIEAEHRGYSHAMHAATDLEGAAEDVGRHLADMAIRMRDQPGPDCLITGGEPVVKLAPVSERGTGGRNQQLVLAALEQIAQTDPSRGNGIVLLSGGTDGEDGPTDAAGALLTPTTVDEMRSKAVTPKEFLRRNDAYHFFEQTSGLIKTGPTHTNVCDVRVVVVSRFQD